MADRIERNPRPAQATDERAAEPPITAAISVAGRPSYADLASTPHADRFRMVIATLAGLAMGALVIAAALIAGGGNGGSGPKWSTWSPTDGGTQGASEIANHLAPFYRLTGADQLDVVTVMNLSSSGSVSSTSSSAGGSGSSGGGLQVAVNAGGSGSGGLSLLSGHTVAYNLCGVGSSDCSVPGTPSTDRLLLLRREALELALYTFKYVSGTQNVVAVLPPGRTQKTSTLSTKPPTAASAKTSDTTPVDIAVLFVRDELQPWLSIPLGQTFSQFPPAVPQLAQWRQGQEAALVDQITARGLFSSHLEHLQDGSSLLVLNQLPPQ